MTAVPSGAIDCDVHVAVPGMAALLPYMNQAVNDLLVVEWLDKDQLLRASIVVPARNPDYAAAGIDRCARDNARGLYRFV